MHILNFISYNENISPLGQTERHISISVFNEEKKKTEFEFSTRVPEDYTGDTFLFALRESLKMLRYFTEFNSINWVYDYTVVFDNEGDYLINKNIIDRINSKKKDDDEVINEIKYLIEFINIKKGLTVMFVNVDESFGNAYNGFIRKFGQVSTETFSSMILQLVFLRHMTNRSLNL